MSFNKANCGLQLICHHFMSLTQQGKQNWNGSTKQHPSNAITTAEKGRTWHAITL